MPSEPTRYEYAVFSARPVIVAWRLYPPLLAMLAVPDAEKVVADAGNSPFTSAEVGATCTDCAVSAEEYQVTMRWASSAPTPRMTPESVAEVSAKEAGAVAAPESTSETPSAAVAIHAARRRVRVPCDVDAERSMMIRFSL